MPLPPDYLERVYAGVLGKLIGVYLDRPTDAAREALRVASAGRRLCGEAPLAPKGGARFHFELPGSIQGCQPEGRGAACGAVGGETVVGHSARGGRSLALRYRRLGPGRPARVATPTFTPPEAPPLASHELLASPTLYPGQTVRAWVSAESL